MDKVVDLVVLVDNQRTATFIQGNTYKLIVGSAGPLCTYSVRWTWTEPVPGGGFTGIFYNSVAFANSALINGGSGGSSRGPENPPSGGGGGGGGTSGGGNGGSQTAAGTPTGPNGGKYKVLVDSVAVVAVGTTVVVEVVISVLCIPRWWWIRIRWRTPRFQLLLHLRHKVATMVELFPPHLSLQLQLHVLVLLVVWATNFHCISVTSGNKSPFGYDGGIVIMSPTRYGKC